MLKNFIEDFLEYLIISVIIGCLFWMCPLGIKTPSIVFVPLFSFLLIIILAQFKHILRLEDKKITLVISPKIRAINEEQGLILANYSELYTLDSYVSFYYNDGEFNIFIGIGLVDSIDKEENKLQIKIMNIRQDYLEKLMNRNLKNIKIRPFANFKSIELLKENNNG